MPAKLGPKRPEIFAHLRLIHGFFKSGHHLARAYPAQITPVRAGDRIVRAFTGQIGKVGAILQLLVDLANALLRLHISHRFGRPHQDMPDPVLLDELLLLTAALVHHHHQMKTTVVFQHLRRLTNFQIRYHRCDQ